MGWQKCSIILDRHKWKNNIILGAIKIMYNIILDDQKLKNCTILVGYQ
jgi:hypothetical protein